MGPIRSVAVGAKYLYTESIGAWRSLVAHLLWEQRVGGSNPLAPTNKTTQGRIQAAFFVGERLATAEPLRPNEGASLGSKRRLMRGLPRAQTLRATHLPMCPWHTFRGWGLEAAFDWQSMERPLGRD